MTFEKLVDEVQGSIEYQLGDLILFCKYEYRDDFSKEEIFKAIRLGLEAVVSGYEESEDDEDDEE